MNPTPREYRRDRGGVDIGRALWIVLLVVVIIFIFNRL